MNFSYRQAIGELIFALTVVRLDISFPVITKLSQYSANPAKEHYQAVKQIFVYLWATKAYGLHYWRRQPRDDLPEVPLQEPVSHEDLLRSIPSIEDALRLLGYSDSDWGTDRTHRRSVTAIVLMLAGAAVLYKTRYQPTIAMSSTEAEFMAAADTGRMALYLRSILNELGVLQLLPTIIYEDNAGARMMTNAQQPTRRTRHMDIKEFAVLQWVEEDHMIFGEVKTENNISDSLSKQTGRTKFYVHTDVMMGRVRPMYATVQTNRDQIHHVYIADSPLSFDDSPNEWHIRLD
jgi:hypothetical protein